MMASNHRQGSSVPPQRIVLTRPEIEGSWGTRFWRKVKDALSGGRTRKNDSSLPIIVNSLPPFSPPLTIPGDWPDRIVIGPEDLGGAGPVISVVVSDPPPPELGPAEEEAIKCIYCGGTLTANDKIHRCRRCNTPHHVDCWNQNNGCANLGCASHTRAH